MRRAEDDSEYELDWGEIGDGPCEMCGHDPREGWKEEQSRLRTACFRRSTATIKFVAQHLPDEGGPWRLVVKDCQSKRGRTRVVTLEDVLRELPRAKVASWEVLKG